jgi:hypothetical protein
VDDYLPKFWEDELGTPVNFGGGVGWGPQETNDPEAPCQNKLVLRKMVLPRASVGGGVWRGPEAP